MLRHVEVAHTETYSKKPASMQSSFSVHVCRICNCLHKEGMFNTTSHPGFCNSIDSSSTKKGQLYPLPLFMLFGKPKIEEQEKTEIT